MTDIPILFDASAVAALQRFFGLGWPGPWRVITLFGSNWGILMVVGFSLWLWGRQAAYALFAIVTVDGIIKELLNVLVYLPRPEAGDMIKYDDVGAIGSFPSGHVSTTAGLWFWLAWRRRIPWLVAIVVVILESLSRLYLGVHFIGDVLGGIVLGALTVALVHWIWPPVRAWLTRRAFGFFVVAALLVLAGVAASTLFWFGTNPYQWRAGGLVTGLAIGLPIEYRYVRYEPGTPSTGRKAAMLAIGLTGLAAIAAIDLGTGEQFHGLGFGTTALASIWTVLAAPALFRRFGWSVMSVPAP